MLSTANEMNVKCVSYDEKQTLLEERDTSHPLLDQGNAHTP
jgi:hypothetical protein